MPPAETLGPCCPLQQTLQPYSPGVGPPAGGPRRHLQHRPTTQQGCLVPRLRGQRPPMHQLEHRLQDQLSHRLSDPHAPDHPSRNWLWEDTQQLAMVTPPAVMWAMPCLVLLRPGP